ncbi:MAG: twin-arginine translocase subunit TatB [Novosphingobium sp.]|nr:twin-arginine translocase subunit TatB [Novosphingobium sp.]
MFDIAPSEILLTVIVAVVVIGPKDLPRALRTAGRWIGKMRRVSGHFRAGIETMIREAELAEMEEKWREQNAAILAQHPVGSEAAGATVTTETAGEAVQPTAGEAVQPELTAAPQPRAVPGLPPHDADAADSPQLPLPPP